MTSVVLVFMKYQKKSRTGATYLQWAEQFSKI